MFALGLLGLFNSRHWLRAPADLSRASTSSTTCRHAETRSSSTKSIVSTKAPRLNDAEVVVVEAIGAATTTRAASKAMALVEATVLRASGNGGGPTRRRSKAPARAKARVMARLQILLIGSPMAPATGGSQRRGPSSGTQSRRRNGRPTTRTRTPPTAWRRCWEASIFFQQNPPR